MTLERPTTMARWRVYWTCGDITHYTEPFDDIEAALSVYYRYSVTMPHEEIGLLRKEVLT